MGYLILEGSLFILGFLAVVIGKIPVTWKRRVTGSPAIVVGIILMLPLPLYLLACRHTQVPLWGPEPRGLDPLEKVALGYARLFGIGAAVGCLLMASVLAIIASEPPRRP